MWRHLADLLVGVEADLIRSVDGKQLVGVDRHQDGAGVRLQEAQTQSRGLLNATLLFHLGHVGIFEMCDLILIMKC